MPATSTLVSIIALSGTRTHLADRAVDDLLDLRRFDSVRVCAGLFHEIPACGNDPLLLFFRERRHGGKPRNNHAARKKFNRFTDRSQPKEKLAHLIGGDICAGICPCASKKPPRDCLIAIIGVASHQWLGKNRPGQDGRESSQRAKRTSTIGLAKPDDDIGVDVESVFQMDVRRPLSSRSAGRR